MRKIVVRVLQLKVDGDVQHCTQASCVAMWFRQIHDIQHDMLHRILLLYCVLENKLKYNRLLYVTLKAERHKRTPEQAA